MLKRSVGLLVLLVILSLLTGCDSAPTGGTPDGQVGASATATATTVAVEPSLTATTSDPTENPTVTPTPPDPTETPKPNAPTNTPAPLTATTIPPTDAPLCRTEQNLNLREGPGLSFNPPIRTLPSDTPLAPLAFSSIGFPGGQWVQVRDEATGDEGWVSAGAQFVSCNIDVTTLPQAETIPPTPTPAAALPPRVRNNAPGGTAADYAEGEVIADGNFLFRMRVLDTRKGDKDGDGIDYVEFFVRTEDFDEIYSRRENTAEYCIFGGGEPDCSPWPKRDGRFVWGGDGTEVQPGKYFISILVTPKDQDFEGEVWNWDFDITVELP